MINLTSYKTVINHSESTCIWKSHLVVALDREVADEHHGQADGAHDRPDKLLAVTELTEIERGIYTYMR